MNDWVEIGVFAPAEEGEEPGKPLHLRKHRIRSGEQTITVTVPRKWSWPASTRTTCPNARDDVGTPDV